MKDLVGQPVNRIDGRLKVTGTATYAAEFDVPGLTYGTLVQSSITKGRITDIDVSRAEKAPGVIKVVTYKNAMSLHFVEGNDPSSGKYAEKDLLPLQSDRIFYNGQHVAIVIAKTFEQAEYAAGLVKVSYDVQKPVFDLHSSLDQAYAPPEDGGTKLQSKRGDADKAFSGMAVKSEETYFTPVYHHNPMEPHASIAVWKGDELTIYDSTQGVLGCRNVIAMALGVPKTKVHLICPFVGGGFGSKGFTWSHSLLAPMAAKMTGNPVKIVISRPQMFTSTGRRSETIQKISLGSDSSGRLGSIKHETTVETSFVAEFVETAGKVTNMLYQTDNLDVSHKVVRLNKLTPCPMRAPGEAPGLYALEVAMDELAEKLKMDPIQLRIVNHATEDQDIRHPFSEKSLLECYSRGAGLIGWSARKAQPGTSRQGNLLVGYGMATASYPANRAAATAKVQLQKDGRALVSCATQDLGTGTYTILAQIAADCLGLTIDKVAVKLGDTDLPKGPVSGGSQTAASVGPAVRAASYAALSKAVKLAINDRDSALYGQHEENIVAENSLLYVKNRAERSDTFANIISRGKLEEIKAEAITDVTTRQSTEANSGAGKSEEEISVRKESDKNPYVKEDEKVKRKEYSFHSFGAHFVKVLVDPDLGMVKVEKIVGVMDIGTVLNLKTAKSQIMGGMIFGLGMALMEETAYDPNNGRPVNHDLANYLVPVHADMPEFVIDFIGTPDPYISPIGSRGIGEIGITGVTAAITNAIYNATGKRVRDLPVTPDKLIV